MLIKILQPTIKIKSENHGSGVMAWGAWLPCSFSPNPVFFPLSVLYIHVVSQMALGFTMSVTDFHHMYILYYLPVFFFKFLKKSCKTAILQAQKFSNVFFEKLW